MIKLIAGLLLGGIVLFGAVISTTFCVATLVVGSILCTLPITNVADVGEINEDA